jgi:hypothetical protein
MFGHDAPECVVEVLPDAPATGMVLVEPELPVELELPVEPLVVAALAIATPPPVRAPVTAKSANAAFMDLMSSLSLTKSIEAPTALAGLYGD